MGIFSGQEKMLLSKMCAEIQTPGEKWEQKYTPNVLARAV